MAGHSSKKVIYAALIGNGLIAIMKFAAAAFTGSAAMMSEGIHSVVDTGNQMLLLHGMKRASKPADSRHPFGYGMELYFWTFVVAILVFAVGAGVAAYEGVNKLLNPHPIANAYVNYLVLGAAMLFEGAAWYVAFVAFRKEQGDRGLLEAVRRSKDPTIFTVLFEDTAAMLGLMVAFAGVAAGEYLGIVEADAIASLVIAAILAMTAILLAYESKGLLIGEATHPEVLEEIRRVVLAEPEILKANELLTMHLGPQDVLLNISIGFSPDLSAEQVEAAVSRLEARIHAEFPQVSRVFIEAQGWAAHLAAKASSEARLGTGPDAPED
ncbi:cation diffusion facilitator family transporter [Oceanibacterium hippocampi]|uniref:Ferrous-iron efflux pump FieF n=1 Tax=Oceanibacterium hippocampi TaxID=745714 RepID=A0A1Y5S8U5_9PROT|nr:cation diffusion facilitator family transporter [Oceanibacterium hippocampi]SLN35109.1 Ferrous-iron efflux pump FieF [Oceanibacterium hippocampi]